MIASDWRTLARFCQNTFGYVPVPPERYRSGPEDDCLRLQPGGTRPPDFFTTVHRVAAGAGRPLAEIGRTGHVIDHPIRFPEGAYLKCLFATAP